VRLFLSLKGVTVRPNIRSWIFALSLSLPVLWSVADTPRTQAINATPTGLLGPNAPALVDTNGNGVPDANDHALFPTRNGNTLRLDTPWDCNPANSNNEAILAKSEGSPKFDTGLHENGTENQLGRFTQFVEGDPVGGDIVLTRDCPTTCDSTPITGRGSARLTDQNGDGVFDGFEGAGRNAHEQEIRLSINFVRVGDYISIPWSAAGVIGVKAAPACGGPLPQVFIPLADLDGDGVPDGVGVDLDGDGQPDPEFFTSPRLTTGCTRGLGYWKNHAGGGPQDDVLSALLPISLGSPGGAKTLTVTTASQAISILDFAGSDGVTNPSNGINKLYAQLLTTKLNAAHAAVPASLTSIIAAADAFLATHDSTDWASLSNAVRQQVLAAMTALDSYNSGVGSVGACQ
jgi:hypothetical protein